MSYGTYVDFTKTFTSICSYLEQSYNWGILNPGWGLCSISILALVQQLSLLGGGGGGGGGGGRGVESKNGAEHLSPTNVAWV